MGIDEKIHGLKSNGYKGYKVVRIAKREKKLEILAINGSRQEIISSGENPKKVFMRLIEIIEGINRFEKNS